MVSEILCSEIWFLIHSKHHSQSTLSLHFFQKGCSFTGPTIVAVRAIFWADTCTSQEKLNQFYPISSRNCSTCMYNVLVRKMKFLEHQWSSCYISLKCIQQDREHFRMLCRYPSCLPSPCSLSVSWWRSNPVFFYKLSSRAKSWDFHLSSTLRFCLFPNCLLLNLVKLGRGETYCRFKLGEFWIGVISRWTNPPEVWPWRSRGRFFSYRGSRYRWSLEI